MRLSPRHVGRLYPHEATDGYRKKSSPAQNKQLIPNKKKRSKNHLHQLQLSISIMPFKTLNQKSIFYTLTPQTENLQNPITTLFIHGLGSSSTFYHTIIPSLSAVSTCITLDTPGSGLSSLGNAPQTVVSIVDDAIALLDALSEPVAKGKVWVVGHSMGGIIACELAIKYAQRVEGLVLIGPVVPSPALTEVFGKRIETVKKGMRVSAFWH